MARQHFHNDPAVLWGVETVDPPSGVDRRGFILRSAVAGAASVMTRCAPPKQGAAASCRSRRSATGWMALTAKEMNSKYEETSESGLAVSVTLC